MYNQAHINTTEDDNGIITLHYANNIDGDNVATQKIVFFSSDGQDLIDAIKQACSESA